MKMTHLADGPGAVKLVAQEPLVKVIAGDQMLRIMGAVMPIQCIALMAVWVGSIMVLHDPDGHRGSCYHLSMNCSNETAGVTKGSDIVDMILDHPFQRAQSLQGIGVLDDHQRDSLDTKEVDKVHTDLQCSV